MTLWPARPIIYEINAWVWLGELSRRHGREVSLGSVPDEAWDGLAHLGIDAVWLMGVWERSPVGTEIAMTHEGLLADFRRALTDFSPRDNVGSPYCIRRYVVDPRLGGRAGLTATRAALAKRRIRLILDFVPNHVAPDHPWVFDHPDYLIAGDAEDRKRDPVSFMTIGDRIFACGRDPHLPAWPDVLQLNVFHPGLRGAVTDTLMDIAGQCDGIRCDMAMLVMNDVFGRTWGGRAGARPETDYWPEMIRAVRGRHPHFLFIGEVYWDMEWELQHQGFDYCYDKRLYDRLAHEAAPAVRGHLRADLDYQERLCRFIENHDEPRAAAVFSPGREQAAALTMATLPGARLFHEGQFAGRRVRLPVFLSRRPDEPVNGALQAFYDRLLKVIALPCLRNGAWRLCHCRGWPDNGSFENLMAWCWQDRQESCLIIVNYAEGGAQGRVEVPGVEAGGPSRRFADLFTDSVYERHGDDIARSGLYVDLPGWGYHVLQSRDDQAP